MIPDTRPSPLPPAPGGGVPFPPGGGKGIEGMRGGCTRPSPSPPWGGKGIEGLRGAAGQQAPSGATRAVRPAETELGRFMGSE